MSNVCVTHVHVYMRRSAPALVSSPDSYVLTASSEVMRDRLPWLLEPGIELADFRVLVKALFLLVLSTNH